MALSGATTPGQCGPGSNGNEGVLRIPQSSSTARTSPSECLVSYPGHSVGGGLTPLQRCNQCILQPQLTGQHLNSEFSFSQTSCLTKAEELRLPYYLPRAGGRIIGFIPFPRVLVLCEMQSVTSRIWTCVAVSISYDDNHYTMGTS